jgi:hypothetical protein
MKSQLGSGCINIPERLKAPANLSLSVVGFMKKMYLAKKVKETKIPEGGNDNLEDGNNNRNEVEGLNNINPYSILISTKGSLAFIYACNDLDSVDNFNNNNLGSDSDNLKLLNENCEEITRNEEEDSFCGFEKFRFDAPEIKIGNFFFFFIFYVICLHFFFFFFICIFRRK